MSQTATSISPQKVEAVVAATDMKLEVVVIPVTDIDRAKAFYAGLGWRFDADFRFVDGYRSIQFTPPSSGCSLHFGTNHSRTTRDRLVPFCIFTDPELARVGLSESEAKNAASPIAWRKYRWPQFSEPSR